MARVDFTKQEMTFALLALSAYRELYGPLAGDPRALAAVDKVAAIVELDEDGNRVIPLRIRIIGG